MRDIIIDNLVKKAGDLNEPGKINKFIALYESIYDRLKRQADLISKNTDCGGCGKREDPRQGQFELDNGVVDRREDDPSFNF